MTTKNTLPTDQILDQIKKRFYDSSTYPEKYYEDQRMLLYAITWPAKWLEQRALTISTEHYKQLLSQRLDDIVKHGEPSRYQDYFPVYLLKTIQRWFAHNGESLYHKLKHIRNQLSGIEQWFDTCRPPLPEDIVTPMAQAHQILQNHKRRKHKTDTQQLTLF